MRSIIVFIALVGLSTACTSTKPKTETPRPTADMTIEFINGLEDETTTNSEWLDYDSGTPLSQDIREPIFNSSLQKGQKKTIKKVIKKK